MGVIKVVSIPGHSKTLNELLKMAQETDLILQSDDGAQFFLARITDKVFYIGDDDDDFGREVEATRKNERLMAFLDERGAQAKSGKGISLEQVRRQLGL